MRLFICKRPFTDHYWFEHSCWTCYYWANFFSISIITLLVLTTDRVQIAFIVFSLWTMSKNCRIILPPTRSEFLGKTSCDNNQEKLSQKKKNTLKTIRIRHNSLYFKENGLYYGRVFVKLTLRKINLISNPSAY